MGDIRCVGERRYGQRILSGEPEEKKFLLKFIRAQWVAVTGEFILLGSKVVDSIGSA